MMVIWLTGLSGAGKTTIAEQLYASVKPKKAETILLDGDKMREVFGGELGFTEPERRTQINRIQRLALFLSQERFCVIVAALYSHPDLLKWNKTHFEEYFEVYVDTPFDIVKQRDSKGLYSGSLQGKVKNVVGVDIPWHEPADFDLKLASHLASPADLAKKILSNLPALHQLTQV